MKTTSTRGRSRSGRSHPSPKVLRDPVHDLIRIGPEDSFILDLIDTKEFQRLRRIRQLGLGSFVYPGAEHTRFAHSLGVFNFARRMIEQLRSRCGRAIGSELKRHAKTIKAAALLHDLGHGPFSHVFERAFENAEGLNHEDWTCRILLDKRTEIHQALVQAEIEPASVVALVCDVPPPGVRPPDQPYLKDIVHSQLDADRMDYLLRDSLMTGSRYGEFDAEWILNVLAIGQMKSGGKRFNKLCLDKSKGTGAIEGMLHARLLMHKYVYGHHATRAYESELICTLRLAIILADMLPDDTPGPVIRVLQKRGNVSVEDYLTLDDEVVWWALRRWAVWKAPAQGKQHDLASALCRHSLRLVRRRKPWAFVELEDPKMVRDASSLFEKIRRDAENALRFECYLDRMVTWPYKDPAAVAGGGADLEEAYFRDIHLLCDGRFAVPIQEADKSKVLTALSERWLLGRFFYDRDFSEEFTGLLGEFGVC